MRVHKAGCHHQAARVDLLPDRSDLQSRRNGLDQPVAHQKIGHPPSSGTRIDHGPATEE